MFDTHFNSYGNNIGDIKVKVNIDSIIFDNLNKIQNNFIELNKKMQYENEIILFAKIFASIFDSNVYEFMNKHEKKYYREYADYYLREFNKFDAWCKNFNSWEFSMKM